MPRSVRYKVLQDEIRYLRRWLLPKRFDPTGSYSERVLTRARGFRVLSHAEVEAYLEDRVSHVANSALQKFRMDSRPRAPLLALLAFSGLQMSTPAPSVQPPNASRGINWQSRISVRNNIERAAASFQEAVRKNNGIKEKNFLRLVIPIGLDPSNLSQSFLLDLDNFGNIRGTLAHQSASSHRTQQQLDPLTEWNTILRLLLDLRTVDEQLTGLI
jgi:hypothetical protein